MSAWAERYVERLLFCLGSSKVNERKKIVEEFLELSDDACQEIVKVLNEFSRTRPSSVTWNKIYKSAHAVLLQVAEKHNDDIRRNRDKPNFRSLANEKLLSNGLALILKIVRMAHEDKDNVFLSVKKMLFSVLQVLDTELYRTYILDGYLTVLEKYIAANRRHCDRIENKHWSDLIKMFERSLFVEETENRIRDLLKPFCAVIQSCPPVVLFDFKETIEKLWNGEDRKNGRFFNTYLVKATTEFCSKVACDRRRAVCELGETVIPIAKDMYSNKPEDVGDTKSFLFDFFLLQMRCHHPNGSPRSSPSSFARSWSDWERCVRVCFYNMIDTEITCVLKYLKIGFFSEERVSKLWDNFVLFATEVFRQVFVDEFEAENHPNTGFDDGQPPPKKLCSEKRYTSLLSNLRPESAWPWLQILASLFKQYPDTVPPSQYLFTLETLTKLSASFDDVKSRRYLISCLTEVSNMQTKITDPEITSAASVSWNKIWEMIRTMWIHQDEADCYDLIRALVLHEKSLRFGPFFRDHVTRTTTVTLSRIRTLAMLCRRRDLFETIDDRRASVRWILKKCSEIEGLDPIVRSPIVARLSAALVFKTVPDFEIDDPDAGSSSIDEILVGACFEEISSLGNDVGKNVRTSVDDEDREILNFLIATLKERSRDATRSIDTFDDFGKVIDELRFACDVCSELYDFDLVDGRGEDFDDVKSIVGRLTGGLSAAWTRFENEFETSSDGARTALEKLSSLFGSKSNVTVSALLRDLVSIELIPTLLKSYGGKEDDSPNDRSFEKRSRASSSKHTRMRTARLHLTELLCNYTFSSASTGLNPLQVKTFSYVKHNRSTGFHVKEDIFIAKSIVRCRPGLFDYEQLSLVRDILDFLFKHRRFDAEMIVDILQILRDFIVHVSLSEHEDLHRSVLDNLKSLCCDTRSYTREEKKGLIECLYRSFTCYPKTVRNGSDENDVPVWSILPTFLHDDLHEIRLFVVPALSSILASADCPHAFKKRLFEDICGKIMNSVDTEVKSCRDEYENRIAAALHCFLSIACSGSTYSRRSIFSIFELGYKKKLKSDSIRNSIETLSARLGDGNVDSFVATNVPYLLGYWHQNGYPMSEFPYRLANSTGEIDFYVKYIDVVVPILLWNNDVRTLEKLSSAVDRPVRELIQENFSATYSVVLPVLACEDAFEAVEIEKAKSIRSDLRKLLSVSDIDSLVSSVVDGILTDLLRTMFDVANFIEEFSIDVPMSELGPRVFDYDTVVKTVGYIEKTILKTRNVIVAIVRKSPSALERVLRFFTFEIEKRTIVEEKLTAIHIYSTLVDIIAESFESAALNGMIPYLIRDITSTFVHLVKKYKTGSHARTICVVCCIALRKFCQKCIPKHASILKKSLAAIIGALIPVSKNGDRSGEVATAFLEYLIAERSVSSEATSRLDLLRSDESQIARTAATSDLESEIGRFLSIGTFSECPVESLRYLKRKLSTGKNELGKMFRDLKNLRGTCEECDASLPHRLVHVLVNLCSSEDENVAIEATKCLGEIGPADLRTPILRAEKTASVDVMKEVDTRVVVAGYVVRLLVDLSVDADFTVRHVACEALYRVVGSAPGVKFLGSKTFVATDFGNGPVDTDHLVPFLERRPKGPEIETRIFPNGVSHERLRRATSWWNKDMSPSGHSRWITSLTVSLLEVFPSDSFLNGLSTLSGSKVDFAEKLIPILIELILREADAELCTAIACGVKSFFTDVWRDVPVNRRSLDCMLDVVYFNKARSNRNHTPDDKKSLELNYLHVAKAALIGSRYFACILYGELWCRETIERHAREEDGSSILEKVYRSNPVDGKEIQNILREAYERIGDTDAMRGCGTSYLLNVESRVDHYKRTGRWDQIVCHYGLRRLGENHDVGPSGESVPRERFFCGTSHVVDALKNAGLYDLARNYSVGSTNADDWESCWRLGRWSFPDVVSDETIVGTEFEKYRYFALKSVHEKNAKNVELYVRRASLHVVETLKRLSSESSKGYYDGLSRLWSLKEIEDFCDFFVSGKIASDVVFARWNEYNRIDMNDFVYIEPVWSQRIALLKIAKRTHDEIVKQSLFDVRLKLAGLARKTGSTSVAKTLLSGILDTENLSSANRYRLTLEDAHLEWTTNSDSTVGRCLLRNAIENGSGASESSRAHALRLYGSWMLEKRWENPRPYFDASLEILDGLKKSTGEDYDTRIDVYVQYAKLTDTEYQKLAEYMTSEELQCKRAFMQKSLEISKALRNKYRKTKTIPMDDRKLICTSEQSFENEKSEIEKAERELADYLNCAMKFYLLAVSESSKHDLKLFRLVSLWLRNRNLEMPEFYDSISKVPAYKFLLLLPQIVPHLSDKNDRFSRTVKEIIRKCAVDHPHHTLPVLLSLANAHRDGDRSSGRADVPDDVRVVAAHALLSELKRTYLKNHIVRMENMSNALIDLAYLPCTKRPGRYPIPDDHPIRKLGGADHVPVPTIEIEIRPSGNYSNVVGAFRWGKTYDNVGGVNAPKKIVCVGTDGISRPQLVKGHDDLRQDAVMQQVFTNLNAMLADSDDRHLKIRTYKIVPLSRRSGILEWCENTMNVGDYLVGNRETAGAHERYRPNDLKPAMCRDLMTGAKGKTVEEKLAVYKTICSKIKPVFHHFFWERFGDTASWWQRRRAYTLSVAASSAVGYVLGLGDRHLSNLLVDTATAEVVHIDFGIAFDQGRLLPTPETVPFRLTRDIEDAMGASGVEGTFRRSFERTMAVLRKNSDTVLSILEVLLYDPLYIWTISAAKAREIQRDVATFSDTIADEASDENEVNFTAKSVLKRLALKLQGREDSTDASIEGQAERLFQRARDPNNLCRLFSGWQPYL